MRIRALDSIRGLLLLQMTLDHFGKPISHYLYQCFGFFSAAEGFFFLSGFVGMLAAASKSVKDPTQSWMRWRAFKTWRYHAVTLLCLCLASYWFLPRVAYIFKSLHQHPFTGALWSATLVNTPEWLDVLPLYVVFLLLGSFVFPLFVKARRKRTIFLLWLPSCTVWIATQFGLRDAVNALFPAWISHGDFDPFGWQFVYFSGAAVSAW
ncbi:MAG: OpgC domain-containing protein [Fibrobacter sp.]|nr:OpgC domain-containing protein [Fibrobacter sp.]